MADRTWPGGERFVRPTRRETNSLGPGYYRYPVKTVLRNAKLQVERNCNVAIDEQDKAREVHQASRGRLDEQLRFLESTKVVKLTISTILFSRHIQRPRVLF